MLTLAFSEALSAPVVERGPFSEVRCDCDQLRGGTEGPVIAEHRDHAWFIGSKRFFRIDCSTSVRVHFEGAHGKRSEVFGPFFHFSSADGLAYADGEICAHIDVDAGRWYCHRDETYWEEMVVESAG
jgi:hypothetical protein